MEKFMIIGHGYVGSAVSSIFQDHEKIIIDPKFNQQTIADYSGEAIKIVFVCVDTPYDNPTEILESVLNELNQYIGRKTPICIKSTAPPEFFARAEQQFTNVSLLHSPEYLDARHNIELFQQQKFCILGGDKQAANIVAEVLLERLAHLAQEHIYYTDIRTASLVKYAENFFLSCKVTIFNELYRIHQQLGCNSHSAACKRRI
jgi:UDP-glucose 6-dehydrogenase